MNLTTRRGTLWVGVVMAGAGLSLIVGPSVDASNAIAEREQMQCTSCHDKPGSRLLTDEGKYYEAVGTLDGFADVGAVFGECTSCHDTKPGSLQLTTTGKRFRRLVGDMDGLRELLESEHVFAKPEDERGSRE